MKSKGLMIAVAMALAGAAPANAGGVDLSAFGTPVDPTVPAIPLPAPTKERASNDWPAHICAEIQRMEHIAISGPLPPTERGVARGGLLMLEQLHCGIDVSRKMAADLAVVDKEKRRADRAFEENMIAAESASRYREPIIVQVPQAADPVIAPPVSCFTNRIGSISTTTCH